MIDVDIKALSIIAAERHPADVAGVPRGTLSLRSRLSGDMASVHQCDQMADQQRIFGREVQGGSGNVELQERGHPRGKLNYCLPDRLSNLI